jgi:hypothetical protein
MARNDLELGAEWVAHKNAEPSLSYERKIMLTETFARMNGDERDLRVGLDASGHQALAERREALRRLAIET